MKFYIPTYEDCINIINNNPDMYFYENKYVIDNYNLSIFGYRYAKYNNFMLPILDNPNINALELKGICFVFDDDGSVFNHHLLLHKFWEIDQYNHCRYELFKDKKIKNITTKEDGYLVSFLKLPNNKIISFTKHGIDETINLKVNDFLSDKNYFDFINRCLNKNIQPIFEYIGTKMYVDYGDRKDLILLKLRCNKTGKYLDIENYKSEGINMVEYHNKTLEQLIIDCKSEHNIEGYVVHFEDDTFLKLKTNWWVNEKNKKIL
ncbi:RNA ligase [Trichloromonas sp.]|jgi:T4 RnlA family RNA ligase|uniref:RNA ligase n=1 Tax=Trichloromonas sp. TaxID=3069249 RepID=UPI002A45E1B7|nr:RNA ligase [Trichloromonas sp.]